MTDTPSQPGRGRSLQASPAQTEPLVNHLRPGNVSALLMELRREVAELRESIGVQLLADRRNASIKVGNGRAVRKGGKLTALYSPRTGEQIDPFPETVEALSALSERDQNTLLQGLGESLCGTSEAKNLRLRLVIGVDRRGGAGGKTFLFGQNNP